ncbi:MAG: DUF2064 domain-containing protein [Dorea sp.]|nr:DUF2064 domain-containing protein [Dorea sp.]
MRKRALIIFTRVPVPGMTKTRLMPYLTPEQCARLHECFLKDIAKICPGTGADIFVCYTLPETEKSGRLSAGGRDGSYTDAGDPVGVLRKIFGPAAEYYEQTGDGLGERMLSAIREVLERGYERCVLIGTDVPEVESQDIRQAFGILDRKDVVFGPTADGGYYLVGMKSPRKEVFEKQIYGHGSVLQNTVRALCRVGISVGIGRTHHDIDQDEDLRAFRDRMRGSRALQRTETGKYLMRNRSISVIVPIYNEEKTIRPLLADLGKLRDRCEIILVDGGSTDRTLEYISRDFRLLHSEKGRARQMNLGAEESTGDILFFLHCDSELPDKPLEQIRYVMKDYRVGCFGIAFHSAHFFLFTCRVISNHRIKDRNVVFGDQGIFIDRKLFFDMGMFPELPIMEDYQFSLSLKERGEKIGITKKRIYTSDRRFRGGTIPKLKEMWKMNRLRKKYRDGVSIDEVARMYEDVR